MPHHVACEYAGLDQERLSGWRAWAQSSLSSMAPPQISLQDFISILLVGYLHPPQEGGPAVSWSAGGSPFPLSPLCCVWGWAALADLGGESVLRCCTRHSDSSLLPSLVGLVSPAPHAQVQSHLVGLQYRHPSPGTCRGSPGHLPLSQKLGLSHPSPPKTPSRSSSHPSPTAACVILIKCSFCRVSCLLRAPPWLPVLLGSKADSYKPLLSPAPSLPA